MKALFKTLDGLEMFVDLPSYMKAELRIRRACKSKPPKFDAEPSRFTRVKVREYQLMRIIRNDREEYAVYEEVDTQ